MALDGYVAFSETEAQKVECQKRLVPQAFGAPFKWVPFADSKEVAMENIMKSSHGQPEAALKPTRWIILHIWLDPEQFLEAFKASRVLRNPNLKQPGWRFYGEMELGNGNSYEWWQKDIPPIGILAWAEKALTMRYKLRADGHCCGCGAVPVPTWATWAVHQKDFCAGCWNAHFLKDASEVSADTDKEMEEQAPAFAG